MEHLPGFREFYPEPLPSPGAWSCDVRQHIFESWRKTSVCHGFREYDGPPLEPLDLYTQKSGEEIVGQLYNFTDKGEREVALRPEMTPTVARMVVQAARAHKKPIKWFSIPQLFRYERQQKGRLREHFQLNCDIFGEASPAADAEVIALLIGVLRNLGLSEEDFVVRLSSRQAWQRFFEAQGGGADRAYEFYQVIDKLEREVPEVSREKLAALGINFDEVQAYIQKGEPGEELELILRDLESRGLSDFVRVDYQVIRGLAYYTGVVFEAFDRKGEFRAIAGGGRYDHLIRQLSHGKLDMPAIGFGMGDVVLTELLRAREKLPANGGSIDIYCVIDDESLRGATLGVVQSLRDGGRSVEFGLTPSKSDKQYKRANELNAKWVIRLERVGDGYEVVVRDRVDRMDKRMTMEMLRESLG